MFDGFLMGESIIQYCSSIALIFETHQPTCREGTRVFIKSYCVPGTVHCGLYVPSYSHENDVKFDVINPYFMVKKLHTAGV